MTTGPVSGKQSYPTPGIAWTVIPLRAGTRFLVSHKPRGNPGGFAYRCAHCHPWPITRRQSRHRPAEGPQRRRVRMERERRR